MNRQSKKTDLFGKLTVLLLALSMLVCLLPVAALAAQSSVALTGNSVADCMKGDTVTVSFEIPAEVYVCDFTALISYDTELLKPVQTENANGEMVWVDTEVFAAGIAANVVEDEGIRVAGATAQAGYRKGGKLLTVSFKVLEDIPKAGTEVKVSFSVFHVAKTADTTEEKTVSVTPAKLTPAEKKQEETPTTAPAVTTQPEEPATEPTQLPAVPATVPQETDQPSAVVPTTVPQEPVETTEPMETTEPVETTTEPAEPTTSASTQPDETGSATTPGTTVPNETQPSGGTEEPAAKPPVGLILGICGGVAVAAGILLFVLLKKKKQKEA